MINTAPPASNSVYGREKLTFRRLNRSQCPKFYIKLVVGTVRISTLAKPDGDFMTEKLNTSRQSPVTVIHQL